LLSVFILEACHPISWAVRLGPSFSDFGFSDLAIAALHDLVALSEASPELVVIGIGEMKRSFTRWHARSRREF
jgi:hypothetical protein